MKGSGKAIAIGMFGVVAVVAVAVGLFDGLREEALVLTGYRQDGDTPVPATCRNDPELGSGEVSHEATPEGFVRVEPGLSIQDAADRAGPEGTVLIAAGVHRAQRVVPARGQTFVGEPGAVMDGGGEPYAFRSAAADVSVAGLVIENYRPAPRQAVVEMAEGATGWRIEGNEIRHNSEIGLRVRRDTQVVGNYIHHNGRYGITGSGKALLIAENTIACNAVDYGPTGDSGGTKFVFTVDLVLRDNDVHHNLGNGLWVDINNVDSIIESNRVWDNELSGIFFEISCGAVIRGNHLTGNGFGTKRPRGVENSAILVANSPNVEVVGNVLIGNLKGIGAIHWHHPNRDSVERCIPALQNLIVHRNSITQTGGMVAGIDATLERSRVWELWNNRFVDNTYGVEDGTFRWEGKSIDLDTWLKNGQS